MASLRAGAPGDGGRKRVLPGAAAFKGGAGEFIRETWIEVTKKTTWPDREELIKSTTVVLMVIIAVAAYLAVWDFLASQFTSRVFGAG